MNKGLGRIFVLDRILIFSIFIFACIKLPYFNYEYGVIPIFLLIVYWVLRAHKNKFDFLSSIVILICIFYLFSSLYSRFDEAVKVITFLLMFLFGYKIAVEDKLDLHVGVVKTSLVIYFIFAILELLIPDIIGPIREKLINKSTLGINMRGVSSLSTEPSFLGLTIFAFFTYFLFVDIGFKQRAIYFLIMLVLLILSKSIISYYVLIFIILICFFVVRAHVPRLIWFLVVSIFGGLVLYFIFLGINETSRVFLVMDGYDQSANSRIYYILKDIYISANRYFIPGFFGSYWLNFFTPQDEYIGFATIYELEFSGSLMGRLLFEWGIFLIIFLCIFLYKFCYVFGMFAGIVFFLFVLVLSFQMISFVFYPFSFALGVLLGSIFLRYSSTLRVRGY
jgi:hypothetical protein